MVVLDKKLWTKARKIVREQYSYNEEDETFKLLVENVYTKLGGRFGID